VPLPVAPRPRPRAATAQHSFLDMVEPAVAAAR
jgi:hypothetical protein